MDKTINQNNVVNQRIKAGLFDAACFAIVCIMLNALFSFISTRDGSKYQDAYNEVTNNIVSSELCIVDSQNGLLTYESEDLTKVEGDSTVFINILSYYYLHYLSGNDVKEDGLSSKQVILYDIEWFNKNILEITTKSFFINADDSENSISLKIGKVNADFVNSNRADYEEFVLEKYNSAVQHFYTLDFIVEDDSLMRTYNNVILVSSTILSLLIFYVLVPSLYKSKQTFGKRIFKLLVVKDDELASSLTLCLRVVPALLICLLLGFIGDPYWEIGIPIVSILISSGFMIFTKSNKCVHDYVAGTNVTTVEKYIGLKDENK